MSSLSERGKETARNEHVIGSVRDRTGAPLAVSAESVCARILAARTGRQGSVLPGGAYRVERARNITTEAPHDPMSRAAIGSASCGQNTPFRSIDEALDSPNARQSPRSRI
jgi:hypothetical protein